MTARTTVGAVVETAEEMLVTPLHIPDSPAWLRIAKKIDDLAEAERKAQTLLRLMELRRIAVDDATRTRVQACGDLAQLDAWFARAANATTLDEVFAVM